MCAVSLCEELFCPHLRWQPCLYLEWQLKEILFVNFMQIFITCYNERNANSRCRDLICVLPWDRRLFHHQFVECVPTEASLCTSPRSAGKVRTLQSFDATPVTFRSTDWMIRLLLDCLNPLTWNSFKAVVECATERCRNAVTFVVYPYNKHCLRQGKRGNRSALAVKFQHRS